jgi:hypothetical protein
MSARETNSRTPVRSSQSHLLTIVCQLETELGAPLEHVISGM